MLWFSRLRPAGRDAELVRHPHQRDQGLRLHLPRDLAAMHIHRHLALTTSIIITGLMARLRKIAEEELQQTRADLARFARVATVGE